MKTILGIDPGLASTGWGVLQTDGQRHKRVDSGVISTKAGLPDCDRLLTISNELDILIDRFQPTVCGIETLYFAKNVSSALPVAQARGVMLLCCVRKDVKVCEYTPLIIKQAVVGNGRADKKQVEAMVRMLLNLKDEKFKSHDSDALAAAICCAHSERF